MPSGFGEPAGNVAKRWTAPRSQADAVETRTNRATSARMARDRLVMTSSQRLTGAVSASTPRPSTEFRGARNTPRSQPIESLIVFLLAATLVLVFVVLCFDAVLIDRHAAV